MAQYGISRLGAQVSFSNHYAFNNIKVPEIEEDARFILAASTKKQVHMLESLPCKASRIIYIEGPHRLWLQRMPVFYYSMRLPEELDDGNEDITCFYVSALSTLLDIVTSYLAKGEWGLEYKPLGNFVASNKAAKSLATSCLVDVECCRQHNIARKLNMFSLWQKSCPN